MNSKYRRHTAREATGLPPGTLIHIGERKEEEVVLTLIDYNQEGFTEKRLASVEESLAFKDSPGVTWLNVDGLHDVDLLGKIGEHFGIHHLVLEDILNTEQRPKIEIAERSVFLTLKMLSKSSAAAGIETEQVSVVLGDHFVISFQEKEGDLFDPIRNRIREGKGRIRRMGPDYLAYSLIDAITDHYFVLLEDLGEQIAALEERLVGNPDHETLRSIHGLKRELINLRRSVWPLREIISALHRDESSLLSDGIDPYLRDLYDHTIQVIDSVENYRDLIAGMVELYMSSMSNRMNEVMKVLTIIATIFIPLTFIAGIYGMNFNPEASPLNMPELDWPFGYLGALGVMAVCAAGMIVYFKRKKWL